MVENREGEKKEAEFRQIILSGPNAGSLLERKGLLVQPDAEGNYVIADFSTPKGYALLGSGQTEIGFETTNSELDTTHEVVLTGGWVKRGRGNEKRLPFPNSHSQPEVGIRVSSKQQFGNGVDIFVRTNVPAAKFKTVVK